MSLSAFLEEQLEQWKNGDFQVSQSQILSNLSNRVSKAHAPFDWIENGFPGLKNMAVEDCLAYLTGAKFGLGKKYLLPDDLEPGMFVIMVNSRTMNLQYWGQSFRLAAMELPFVLLEPAVKILHGYDLISVEAHDLKLMRCSKKYFNLQRAGNGPLPSERKPVCPRCDGSDMNISSEDP
ncbi:MAG: hypothetical protein EXR99_08435 [Gemmataceae bacterium]|nr:hypothetical protein [Gemmataceae bacterium]